MSNIPPPRPWTVTSSRELSDANGNVVQYTFGTLGQIALAVNAYDIMIQAIAAVSDFLDRSNDPEAGAVKQALHDTLGWLGKKQLAAQVDAVSVSSPDINRRIASELQVPELDYTGSIEAARSLSLRGWKFTSSEEERLDPITTAMAVLTRIVMRGPNGEEVEAVNQSFACAYTACALRAREAAKA